MYSPVPAEAASTLPLPTARIQTEADLAHFLRSPGCISYLTWLQQLASKLVGTALPVVTDDSFRFSSEAVRLLTALLTTLEQSIASHPPSTGSQRYGNLSFRSWSAASLTALPQLVDDVLPATHKPFLPHLVPLLSETSPFGNATRLDFGTGHEAAFFLFLFALRRIGILTEADDVDVGLIVFPAYLKLVWALQDTYKLEPAGSHGVWGLDDYGFLPYFFGSAQLLRSSVLPSALLPASRRLSSQRLRDPTLDTDASSRASGPAKPIARPQDLWTLSLQRVDRLKTGPWSEHSPLLYGLSTQVSKGWPKIHDGLRKMYEAEVLGKLVVVRGLRVGGLIAWD